MAKEKNGQEEVKDTEETKTVSIPDEQSTAVLVDPAKRARMHRRIVNE